MNDVQRATAELFRPERSPTATFQPSPSGRFATTSPAKAGEERARATNTKATRESRVASLNADG